MVKVRKHLRGVYETETEVLLAHLQTEVGSRLAGYAPQVYLLFYDITPHFLQHLPEMTTAEAVQTPLLLDACSFTVSTSGCSVVTMIGARSQHGLMVEVDATTSLTNVRVFSRGTGCAKILGLNHSSQDELD